MLSPRRFRALVLLYGVITALLAFALSHDATINIDENIYFDMAKQLWTRGTFEIPNGLEIIDSDELYLGNTVKRGRHLFGKYPPLYAVLAAPCYALFGLRGLILLNAVGVGLTIVAFALLALPLLGQRRALAATLALPLCTPLLAYGVIIVPHSLAAAFLTWTITIGHDATTATTPRRAALLGLAAGLTAGMAGGIRYQTLLGTAVLILVILRSRQRAPILAGMLASFGSCLVLAGWLNSQRFGSWNPISYGPPALWGSPPPVESISYFFHQPVYYALAVLGALTWWGLSRYRSRPSDYWRAAMAVGIAAVVIVAWPSLRHTVAESMRSLTALIVDASVLSAGWMQPLTLHGWIRKSLLQTSPALVLGTGAALYYALQQKHDLLRLFALSSLITFLFLSLRPLAIQEIGSVLGTLSYSPRYLVEIMPLLYGLSWYTLREIELRRWSILVGLIVGGALLATIWLAGRGSQSLIKQALILYGSLGIATALAGAYLLQRLRLIHQIGTLGLLFVLALAYGCAITIGEDLRCKHAISRVHAGWIATMSRVLPDRLVLVGYDGAMHGPYALRHDKQEVVMVDISVDQGKDVLRVLKTFSQRGYPLYYFGLGLERVRSQLASTFRPRLVIRDPLVWKLEPLPARYH